MEPWTVKGMRRWRRASRLALSVERIANPEDAELGATFLRRTAPALERLLHPGWWERVVLGSLVLGAASGAVLSAMQRDW
jgi:hypothetical protein